MGFPLYPVSHPRAVLTDSNEKSGAIPQKKHIAFQKNFWAKKVTESLSNWASVFLHCGYISGGDDTPRDEAEGDANEEARHKVSLLNPDIDIG
jgi:hypothetical protein